METTDKKETKERSGSYRLVKICINEIEAMKILSLGRETILKNLKEYFGTQMTVRQLSSNIYRVEEELKDELAGQSRQDQIAELVKNRELIYKNFSVLKKLVDPSYIPLLDERRAAPTPAKQVTQSVERAVSSPVATVSKPPMESIPFMQPSDEVRSYVAKVQKIVNPYLTPSFDGNDRRFLNAQFSNAESFSHYQQLESTDQVGWRKTLLNEIEQARLAAKQ